MHQDVVVIKVEHVSAQVRLDHVRVDQTVHVEMMEHANVQKDVLVTKMVPVFVLVKQDLVCADQIVIVVTQ